MNKGETFLILGGGGMIGAQVVHEISRELSPKAMIICSRNREDVDELIEHCKAEFPQVEFTGFWGDIFIRADWNNENPGHQISRAELISSPELRSDLFDDVFHDVDAAYERSQLVKLILDYKPDVVVDSINTATAISYQDVYTAAELAKNSFHTLKTHVEEQKAVEDVTKLVNRAEKDIDTLLISQSIPQLIRHVLLIHRAMSEAGARLYLKIGTTGTGGMGLNIPYTHSEDKPSTRLMTKTAIAFAHTGLMFLMARTPGGPIVKELKPGAMVGYSNIAKRVICERGKLGNPLHVFHSRKESLDGTLTLREQEATYEAIGKLQMVIVDTGENGFFTTGEFEAITHMGQMEYITPEEIAHQAVLEIKGSNTGYDVIAAVDSTVMNPTYRAGCLRHIALDEADYLEEGQTEEEDAPSVALGQLGPPEIGKLLWEAYLLKKRFGTLSSVLSLSEETLASEITDLLKSEPKILHTINAVGLPVLTSDGKSLLRGPLIRIPEIPGVNEVKLSEEDIDKWGKKGWVDLRPQNFGYWRRRFQQMQLSKQHATEKGSAAVTLGTYPYQDIRIGAVVAWIFNNEILGYRIK